MYRRFAGAASGFCIWGLLICAVSAQEVPEYRWSKVTESAAYTPRDGAGALVFQGKMWLLGGWNPADKKNFPRICNNEVWNSTNGADWTLAKPNTFLDRSFDPTSDWECRPSRNVCHMKSIIAWSNDLLQSSGVSAEGGSHVRVPQSRPGPACDRTAVTNASC